MRNIVPVVVLVAVGCASVDDDGGGDVTTEQSPDDSDDTDVVDTDAEDTDTEDTDAPTPEEEFALVVTESPPGPDNGDPLTWSGVLQYTFVETGAPLVEANGISKDLLHDPAGLAFQPDTSELFVGNRHGNNAADGVAGSITRFLYDADARSFTPNGEITGNGLGGVHQMAFDPNTGELFAANVTSGVSRFTFDLAGNAMANGVIGTGTMRGVLVAPGGTRLYATSAGDGVRQFDLGTGVELGSVFLASGAVAHYVALRGDELFVAGVAPPGRIYRLSIASDDSLTLLDSFAASEPAAVAFSEDGLELFSAGHRTSTVLERFRYDATNDAWTLTDTVDTVSSLGALLVLE